MKKTTRGALLKAKADEETAFRLLQRASVFGLWRDRSAGERSDANTLMEAHYHLPRQGWASTELACFDDCLVCAALAGQLGKCPLEGLELDILLAINGSSFIAQVLGQDQ